MFENGGKGAGQTIRINQDVKSNTVFQQPTTLEWIECKHVLGNANETWRRNNEWHLNGLKDAIYTSEEFSSKPKCGDWMMLNLSETRHDKRTQVLATTYHLYTGHETLP